MASAEYLEYQLGIYRDPETGFVVAEVPALGIADDGEDQDEALANIRKLAAFHIDCLIEEGEAIPAETRGGEGIYLRIRRPARAA